MSRDLSKTIETLSAYEMYRFASYLPTRYEYDGKFKRHKTLGHAKSAVLNAASRLRYHHDPKDVALVYQFDENEFEWVHILTYSAHSDTWTEEVVHGQEAP